MLFQTKEQATWKRWCCARRCSASLCPLDGSSTPGNTHQPAATGADPVPKNTSLPLLHPSRTSYSRHRSHHHHRSPSLLPLKSFKQKIITAWGSGHNYSNKFKKDLQVALLGAACTVHVLFVTAPITLLSRDSSIFSIDLNSYCPTKQEFFLCSCLMLIHWQSVLREECSVLSVWVEFHRLLWEIFPSLGHSPRVWRWVQTPAVAGFTQDLQGPTLERNSLHRVKKSQWKSMSFCCAVLPRAAQQNPAAPAMSQPLHWGSTAGRLWHRSQPLQFRTNSLGRALWGAWQGSGAELSCSSWGQCKPNNGRRCLRLILSLKTPSKWDQIKHIYCFAPNCSALIKFPRARRTFFNVN